MINKNNNKGITLIVLVITIIILLLIAGISILSLTGNGIFKKSTLAVDENNKKSATEIINFKITECQIQSWTKKQEMPSLQELANNLYKDEDIEYVELLSQKQGDLPLVDIGTVGADSIFTKLKEYPYEFEINGSLQLASIDGVKIANNENNDENSELKTRVSALETKVNALQSKVLELSTTSGTALKKTDLFYGKADTTGKEYVLNDDVTNYSFLIVYATLGDADINNRANVDSIVIDTADVLYSTTYNEQYIVNAQVITGSNLYSYAIRFGFIETTNESGKIEKNKFKIDSIRKGSGYSPYPAYIYKIVGIK